MSKKKYQIGQFMFRFEDECWFYGHGIDLKTMSKENIVDFIDEAFGEKEKEMEFLTQFYIIRKEENYGHYGRGIDDDGDFQTHLLYLVGHKGQGSFPVTIFEFEQKQLPKDCVHFKYGETRYDDHECIIHTEKKDFWRGSLSCRHCLQYIQKEKQKEIIITRK